MKADAGYYLVPGRANSVSGPLGESSGPFVGIDISISMRAGSRGKGRELLAGRAMLVMSFRTALDRVNLGVLARPRFSPVRSLPSSSSSSSSLSSASLFPLRSCLRDVGLFLEPLFRFRVVVVAASDDFVLCVGFGDSVRGGLSEGGVCEGGECEGGECEGGECEGGISAGGVERLRLTVKL